MSSKLGVQNIAHTNGTNAMTVSSSGVVTFANSPSGLVKSSYVFVYNKASTGYQTGSTGDFLPLNTVFQHKGTGNSDYNTSTYKYTAPVSGIYQIHMKTIVASTSISTDYRLNVDGTDQYTFTWSASRNVDQSTSFYLDAGQVVGFRNGNNAGYYRNSNDMPTGDVYTAGSYHLLQEIA